MFINEFMTSGFREFYNGKTITSFESHTIACLSIIYGKKELLDSANTSENEFITLIRKYGYPESSYMRFLAYITEYEEFKKEKAENTDLKTNIYNKIEVEIINMFGFKYLLGKCFKEEIEVFEKALLNDPNINKLKENVCINPEFTSNYWNKKKKEFKNNVELETIKIDYLDEDVYNRFNLSMDSVKQMDYRMVNQLNKSIIERLKNPEEEIKPLKRKSVLSNESGYVDVLIMVGIITCIITAGFIYVFVR